MKSFFKKYKHAWPILYIFIYAPWFLWLEQRNVSYTLLHTSFDDIIPFSEYFIIPYFIWFLYIPAVVLFFLFKSKKEFYKLSQILFIGMTACLLICTLWPNAQPLRVSLEGKDNIFAQAVSTLYTADTSTNVFPSIHAYNSIACSIAIFKSEIFKNKRWVKYSTLILTILICLSTMFLKQHSVLDVLGAIVLSGIMYTFVYVFSEARESSNVKNLIKTKNSLKDFIEE